MHTRISPTLVATPTLKRHAKTKPTLSYRGMSGDIRTPFRPKVKTILKELRISPPGCHVAMGLMVRIGYATDARGVELLKADQLEEAENVLKAALAADLFFGPAHNNLGLVFEAVGKLDDAAKWYEAALELEPDTPEIIGNLARLYVRRDPRDPRTRELLEDIILKDTRPDWSSWARERLGVMESPSAPETPSPTE